MKPSVILYKALPDNLFQRLEEHFTVTQVANLKPETVEQHAEAFASATGLLGSSETVNSALLEKMPALRATSTISVGYDNFDVDALNSRKIALMHTPTVLTETVADTMMALVLSSARRVVEVAERVKAGEWTKSIGPDWFGVDVHHKTLGIVGMGRIGLALAQRAHFGFDMPILYNARHHHSEAEERFNARYCELDALLEEADFVCVVLPLTEETHHMIGAKQFAKMKSSAIFINAGRGPVVDEQALIEALKTGQILAAGLDVFEQEPLAKDSPLLSLPNVVALPHIGSATHETRYNMAACAVDNLIDALNGKVDKNCVNPQVRA
ncbi:glyoxylate/hydroxypyruvate reductase GhrB [Superficieibacter sp.]|uniref:glyoxylate/hydroxypyruvate reductase GhrB n=1 Tax=Superficieibacter sp. TaxID=2303322 RepID=UPI0028A787A3|nr:glyoxylate/hydroxypyruvate reductase GhrB [Superficieibacter sp.]